MSVFELDDHSRTIIHIDLDCFYAQVEMNKNPNFRSVPLGIQQKNIVVTSNYKAREFGIKKCMLIAEAKKLCPNLVLANGEDLHDYRQTSYKVTNLLQKYSHLVERLGLDENFVDVTALINEKLKKSSDVEVVGNISGDSSEKCDCGCTERLTMGTVIAQEIRDLIKNDLNLTTCAGIAHNKLLAKIVGSRHKPDQQTVVFPNSALELMLSLDCLTNIPGIGRTTFEQLESVGIKTIEDLQNGGVKKLEPLLGADKARIIHNFSYGIDKSQVKPTGKPQSIGLEDSCKSISVEKEVRNKLEQLLNRLLLLVAEDGRIPKTIKLTVRKFNKENKVSHRETRQSNINPSLFSNQSANKTKIMTTIMHLFNRIIDVKKPYHITLLGLSFTKFQEPPNLKNSVASFLRRDLEVQSVISIESQNGVDEPESPVPSTSSVELKDVESPSPSPSPKKLKLSNLVTKKRCFEDYYEDCESPSKLKVADLCLESVSCPPDADQDVFKELPLEMQKELWEDYKRRRSAEMNLCSSQVKKPKPNTLLNYFIRNN
ncbi:IMS and/or HHH 5 domain containing protein [Asbolus verrucosus]|uniref:IMS and/or HHH 5 domain containing protein n=1 Tax=Asbolus verrucosus TaxID=1661398 RepID=A0A482VIA2_ASBVE|nr:IMS and/or HHH 5 domain containing protein [Asbolus verrucosus]